MDDSGVGRPARAAPTLGDAIEALYEVEKGYIHQDIQCDGCGEAITGPRIRCNDCLDFDFCTSCSRDQVNSHHSPSHSFYRIQYGRLTLPPSNGEDLAMLQHFESGTTSESFYMHYPWFFSPDIFAMLISGTPDEEESRHLLEQLEAGLEGSTFDLALDGLVRLEAKEEWNWKMVQDRTRPLLELHILRAQFSPRFHRLYTALDTTTKPPPIAMNPAHGKTLTLRHRLFTAALDSDAEEAFKEAANSFLLLPKQLNVNGGLPSVPTDRISASAKYTEMLSKGFDLNSTTLPIFDDVESLLARRKSTRTNSRWSISQSMKSWEQYTQGFEEFTNRLEVYLSKGSFDSAHVTQEWGILCAEPVDGAMSDFRLAIINKDYSAAEQGLRQLSSSSFQDLFHIMRFHEARGDITRAYGTAQSCLDLTPTEGGQITRVFEGAKAYFDCLSNGNWNPAIMTAMAVFERTDALTKSASTDQLILQLYSLKIFFLGMRDRGQVCPERLVPTLTPYLRDLRNCLISVQWWDLALDVVELEMEIPMEKYTIFELEQTEYLQHRRVIIPSVEHAMGIFEELMIITAAEKHRDASRSSHTVAFEKSLRLLLSRLLTDHDLGTMGRERLERILNPVSKNSSPVCQAEAALFGLAYNLELINNNNNNNNSGASWVSIENCFRDHKYFKGLLMLCERKAASEVKKDQGAQDDASLVSTSPALYRKMLPIAIESGNELLARLCRVRSMRSWIEGPSFIVLCESMFHPSHGFLSDQIFFEASKLLAQTYEINNNNSESAAFALLHLRVAFARRDDLTLDNATMLHFRCVGNLVSTIADKDKIFEVASLLFSFFKVVQRLCHSALRQLVDAPPGSTTISAGSLPIESLLWPAHIIRHIIDDDFIQAMSPEVIMAVYHPLKLAVDFLALLPVEFRILFHSSVCNAVGLAAEMMANPVLSLLCYDLGQSRADGADGYMPATLHLRIGRRLSSWIYHNRPDFEPLQDLAFQHLDIAEKIFWIEGTRQSSYQNALETSMILARAHLRELQAQIEVLDWGEGVEDESASDEQRQSKDLLLGHINRGLLSVQKSVHGNFEIRRRLSHFPAMQALENSRLVYFGNMEELYWNNMGLEMDKSRITGESESFFAAVQRWKAVSLLDVLSSRLDGSVNASNLQKFDAPSFAEDPTLGGLSSALELNEKGEQLEFDEEVIWSMAEVAEAHIGKDNSIIFVDWTRYYDTLLIVAFDGTRGIMRQGVVELDYHSIEEWVREHLGVSSLHEGRTQRRRLNKLSHLGYLTPLFERLEGLAKPGDLLVLCPSGILHAVPLHAIPFGEAGKPLIISNPVVFNSSLSLLRNCVSAASEAAPLPRIPTSAFTRLGPDDVVEEGRMHDTAVNSLTHDSLELCITSGRQATLDAFLAKSKGARLLHYHGHAYLEAAQRKDRALQLEPQPGVNDGLLSVMDIFDLRLNAAVVMLLACASGEDDVGPNDDPLGLLSAFLYAGAASIIATRWPTQTSDARDFATRLYRHAFASRRDGVVSLAHAVQAAVVEMYNDWDEDDPYHWAQFQLHGAWFAKI